MGHKYNPAAYSAPLEGELSAKLTEGYFNNATAQSAPLEGELSAKLTEGDHLTLSFFASSPSGVTQAVS